MILKRTVYVCALFTLLLAETVPAQAQFRFRFRPYLALGASYIPNPSVYPLNIEDDFDHLYYEENLANPRRISFRAQSRFNLVSVGDVSLGYMFWGNGYHYPDLTPNDIVKLDTDYPNSYSVSLHLVTLQWDINIWPLARRHFHPLLLAGYGTFFALTRKQHYEWLDESEIVAGKVVEKEASYSGHAVIGGIGVVVFKYIYGYLGVVVLNNKNLPQHQFLDLVVGVTL